MEEKFEKYERDYVRWVTEGYETLESKQERLLQEKAVNDARETELDSWDYAVLEMIKRGAMDTELKFGTMRTMESSLKLYSHGLIYVRDYTPTFNELEKRQQFLDSVIYKQYLSSLEKIMTEEVRQRINLIYDILGINIELSFWEKIKGPDIKKFNYSIELTNFGKKTLGEKRTEALIIYEKTNRQYRDNRLEFHRNVETMSPMDMMLPLMIAMGLSGGMIGHMASMSGTEYTSLYGEFGELNMPFDAGSGMDVGDFSDSFSVF